MKHGRYDKMDCYLIISGGRETVIMPCGCTIEDDEVVKICDSVKDMVKESLYPYDKKTLSDPLY